MADAAEALAQRFVDGLRHLEETGDPDPLVALYADESETSNVVADRLFAGQAGARDFWQRYQRALGEAHSSFRNVIVVGDRAALEWETAGTSPDGKPYRYDGVSLLEMAGDGDAKRVTRFRAFFDSAKLGHQMHDPIPAATTTTTAAATAPETTP